MPELYRRFPKRIRAFCGGATPTNEEFRLVKLEWRPSSPLRDRAAELDARGDALVAELGDLMARMQGLAFDAIEDEGNRPAFLEARRRQAALPAELVATADERNALDAEIALAEAALREAELEAAVERVRAKPTSAPRSPLRSTRRCATLARSIASTARRPPVDERLVDLRVEFDVNLWDRTALAAAMRAAGHDLALAVGQTDPQANARPLAHSDGRRMLREALRFLPASVEVQRLTPVLGERDRLAGAIDSTLAALADQFRAFAEAASRPTATISRPSGAG